IFTMRHFQGSIPYLTCLLTEDCTEKSLLCCQLSLSLWSYFSDKDISRAHLGADADDTSLIQIFQCIIALALVMSRHFLRSELCISCLCLILFDVDRSINIILYQSLT